MKINFCYFISERWNKLFSCGKRRNKWKIREFSGKPVPMLRWFFLWKDFLGQGRPCSDNNPNKGPCSDNYVTQQMSDERKITNYIQEKISNLQKTEKSRKLMKVSVAVRCHVAFEILACIQNWCRTMHRRYRWDSHAERHQLEEHKTQTMKRAKDSRCRGNLRMFLYEEFVD